MTDIKQVLEKASLRPWKPTEGIVGFIDCADFSRQVAVTYGRTSEEREANIELIVAAVNSYESQRELIASMKEALRDSDTLLLKLCTVAMHADVERYLPGGLLDEVKQFLRVETGKNDAALARAKELGL